MKKVLIVEDNEKHMKVLDRMLSDIDDIKIYKAYNMVDACYMLSLREYHLFIVDIILDTEKTGDVSGINFVKLLRDNKKYTFTPVIFTTSLEDPKLYAYSDLHCYQYIEKPFDEKYVKKVVMEALSFPATQSKKEYGYFRKDGILYSVKISEIMYITLGKPGVSVYTENDCLKLGYYTAYDMQRELQSDDFVKCNRNTLINKSHIEYVDFGNGYVKLKDIDKKFELGAICKKNLREEFKSHE